MKSKSAYLSFLVPFLKFIPVLLCIFKCVKFSIHFLITRKKSFVLDGVVCDAYMSLSTSLFLGQLISVLHTSSLAKIKYSSVNFTHSHSWSRSSLTSSISSLKSQIVSRWWNRLCSFLLLNLKCLSIKRGRLSIFRIRIFIHRRSGRSRSWSQLKNQETFKLPWRIGVGYGTNHFIFSFSRRQVLFYPPTVKSKTPVQLLSL